MPESLAFEGCISSTPLVAIFWIFFPGQSLASLPSIHPAFGTSPRIPALTPTVGVGLTRNLSGFTAIVQPGSWGCENWVALVSLFIAEIRENERQGGRRAEGLPPNPKCEVLSDQANWVRKQWVARVAERCLSQGGWWGEGITFISLS